MKQLVRTPQISVVGLVKVASEAFAFRSIVLLLLTPRALTHQRELRGFAFGRSNAVRQWLDLGYPVTRASQSREGGRILRAWWLKESEVVRCDDMAPKVSIEHRAKPVLLR
mgnify:CR=1 FL=1